MTALPGEYALHLFHWEWQGTLVALAVLTIVRVVPRSSARFRSTVLLIALCKFLLPPMLPSGIGLFSRVSLFGAALLRESAGQTIYALGALLAVVHAGGAFARIVVLTRIHRALRRDLPAGRTLGRVRVVVVPYGHSITAPVTFGWV
ncbi:MAG TPA: hypothetical protein VHU41_05195, partial [Thermoanaerobaculia bacterium]|nr:hypothetical protein [Thermoanaerobaculia bacterium]